MPNASEIRHQEICSSFARQVKAARLNLNLSMSEVAQRAGLSQQMVSYVERELRNPTLDTMLRIADALEHDLVDLIQKAQKSPLKPERTL